LSDDVIEAGAVVPTLWRLEVANSLTIAIRRKRIDQAFRNAAMADLSSLDIVTDHQTDALAWSDTLAVADHFGLTLYDAAYVELARRQNLPLATLDRDMAAAAAALGLKVLGHTAL
jgi:predicted nucleic acid-binding protein